MSFAHPDFLDYRENLRSPLMGSLVIHGSIVAAVILAGIFGGNTPSPFGDQNSFAGGTPITPVNGLDLRVKNQRFNPVANDTQSQVPQQVDPIKRRRIPDPEAIAIGPKKPKKEKEKEKKLDIGQYATKLAKMRETTAAPSTTAQALGSPLVGKQGAGTIGVGEGNPFGNRFGYYAQLIQQCVAGKWSTQEVDPQVRSAPPVVVTSEILKNGSVRDIRVVQKSGNLALDYSAQRAVTDCNPFPPLPDGFERNSARIEFQFQLKR